jgi:hypothetical protein
LETRWPVSFARVDYQPVKERWYFNDSGEHSSEIQPVAVSRRALYELLDCVGREHGLVVD